MDALARRPLGINVAPLVPLTPLRHYVLGEASFDRAATPDETATLGRLYGEALDAGHSASPPRSWPITWAIRAAARLPAREPRRAARAVRRDAPARQGCHRGGDHLVARPRHR
jgi:hypothetical protein